MKSAGLWAAAVAVLGCSDDSGGSPLCASVSPCGGDLVGTWNIVAQCNDNSRPFPGCARASVAQERYSTSGDELTIDGDAGAFCVAGNTLTVRVEVPELQGFYVMQLTR